MEHNARKHGGEKKQVGKHACRRRKEKRKPTTERQPSLNRPRKLSAKPLSSMKSTDDEEPPDAMSFLLFLF